MIFFFMWFLKRNYTAEHQLFELSNCSWNRIVHAYIYPVYNYLLNTRILLVIWNVCYEKYIIYNLLNNRCIDRFFDFIYVWIKELFKDSKLDINLTINNW